jgi:hypothetical protein
MPLEVPELLKAFLVKAPAQHISIFFISNQFFLFPIHFPEIDNSLTKFQKSSQALKPLPALDVFRAARTLLRKNVEINDIL